MPPRTYLNQAQKVTPPRSTGGTSAPRSAAGGNRAGVGQGRTAYNPQRGVGGGRPAVKPAPITGTTGAQGAGREPTPWDSQKEAAISGANRNYLGQSHNLDFAETGLKQDYGLDPAYNDYKSNPYSRAALLEQHFQEGNRGVMNNAGLQLYSGSTGNRLAQNRQGYGQDRDALAKSYRDALAEITSKRIEAAENKGNEETEAGWNAIGHAEEAPLDPTQAPVPKKKQGGTQRQGKTSVSGAKALPPKKKGKK